MRTWSIPDKRYPDVPAVADLPTSLTFSDIVFTSETPIAEGGDATVYEASVPVDGRHETIAVKQPKTHGTMVHDEIENLLSEAQIWDQVDDHDHVVELLAWDSQPQPWLAMEYMDQGSLRSQLEARTIPISEALWIGRCLADAVRHGHRLGAIPHLDIKPANILFQSTGPDTWNLPKLSDWGLGTRLSEITTGDGYTPSYAAPEQLAPEGSPSDYTDIYQLGLILYELLTGTQPYDESGLPRSKQVLDPNPAPVPPSERRRELTREVDAVIGSALAHDPANRYETVVNLRIALEALQGESRLPPIVQSRLTGDDTEYTQTNPSDSADLQRSTSTSINSASGPDASSLPALQRPGDRLLWSTAIEGAGTETRPVVTGDTVIVSTSYNTTALAASDGDIRWHADSGSDQVLPAIYDEAVYLFSYAHVAAVDLPSGTQRWSFSTEDDVKLNYIPPVEAGDTVYIGTGSGLRGVDRTTGEEVWQFGGDQNLSVSSTVPIVFDDLIVFTAFSDSIRAVDIASREQSWAIDIPDSAYLTAADGTLYAALRRGPDGDKLLALDPRTGKIRWQATLDGINTRSVPTIAETTVYHAHGGGCIHAFAANTGDQIWQRRVDPFASVLQRPVLTGDILCIACNDHLVGVDTISGQQRWQTPISGAGDPGVPLAVRDHTVYVGSEDGCVYAIDADTGETIWQYDTDAPISSGIGVGPHRVYALSNGRMYGLRRE
jgi:outer membrane protein assembly factor BamB